MIFKGFFQKILLAVLLSFSLTACQKASDVLSKTLGKASSTTAKVVVQLPSQLSSSSSMTSSAATAASNGQLTPDALSEFNCFAINVIAADMSATSVCGGRGVLGSAVGFAGLGSKFEIDVPIGANRLIQVWGFANATSCPTVSSLSQIKDVQNLPVGATGPGFLLGQKAIDVLSKNTSVNIPLSYNLTTSQVICGTLPNPDTTISYAKISPTEVVTVTNGSTITSTDELCIGFTTTARSPQYTCYQDDIEVPCAQGSCTSLAGGSVHQFISSPLTEATHTFRIETKDITNGLYDLSPATFTWTIDNTASAFSIIQITPGSYNTVNSTYDVSTTNPVAFLSINEPATLSYTANASPSVNCASPSFSGTFNCAVPNLNSGLNAMVFSAQDRAGNAAANIATNIHVDTVKPNLDITPTDHWLFGGNLTDVASPEAAIPTASDTAPGEIDSATLECSVENASYNSCPAALTFTHGGRSLVRMRVKDFAGNQTRFSNYVWLDSLLGLFSLGRLSDSSTSLFDESVNTTTLANQPWKMGLNTPAQTAIDTSSGFVYVADSGNNRVLVFPWSTAANQASSTKAVGVFGQDSFYEYESSTANTASRTPLNAPQGVAVNMDLKKLFIADTGNNRVLRFDISTGYSNKLAEVVFGQTTFTGNQINIAGNTSTTAGANLQNGLNTPTALSYDSTNDRLYVTDKNNCRVGVFSSAASTTTNGDSLSAHYGANGQTLTGSWDCTSDAVSDATLRTPNSIALDISSNRLYVADSGFNRVAVWNISAGPTMPTPDITTALGHHALDVSTAGDDDLNPPHLTNPLGVAVTTNQAGTKKIAVSVSSGTSIHKVKFFDPVDGSVDAVWNSAGIRGTSPQKLSTPNFLTFENTSKTVLVTDAGNHRVSGFTNTTYTSDKMMNRVLGHSTFSENTSFYAGAANNPNDVNLNAPKYVAIDSIFNRLYVSDTGNHRVLVFPLDPTTKRLTSLLAVSVIGTANISGGNAFLDSSTTAARPSAETLSSPQGLVVDRDGKLWVSDYGNNRVLRFPTNTTSLSVSLSADFVLGQSNFSANSSGMTATTLSQPTGLAYDSETDKLFIADTGNTRIQIFENLSTTHSGASATATIGGASGTDTDQFQMPENLFYTQGISGVLNKGLFVTDRSNHRVAYFDFSAGTPTDASACYGHRAASIALQCQTASANDGGTIATAGSFGLNSPHGVYLDATSKYLYITDTGNARVVVYNLATAANQPSNGTFSSSNVIFHAMGAPSLAASSGITIATPNAFSSPVGILGLVPSTGASLLFIIDSAWHRLGMYEVP